MAFAVRSTTNYSAGGSLLPNPDLPVPVKPVIKPVIKPAPVPVKIDPVKTELKEMGFLSNIASSFAKKVLPKITVGGDKDDRKAVQNFVATGAADPIFEKFGDSFETGVKVAGAIGLGALTSGLASGPLGSGRSTLGTGIKNLVTEKTMSINWGEIVKGGLGALSGALGSGAQEAKPVAKPLPSWVVPVAIGAAILLFGKKLLK